MHVATTTVSLNSPPLLWEKVRLPLAPQTPGRPVAIQPEMRVTGGLIAVASSGEKLVSMKAKTGEVKRHHNGDISVPLLCFNIFIYHFLKMNDQIQGLFLTLGSSSWDLWRYTNLFIIMNLIFLQNDLSRWSFPFISIAQEKRKGIRATYKRFIWVVIFSGFLPSKNPVWVFQHPNSEKQFEVIDFSHVALILFHDK